MVAEAVGIEHTENDAYNHGAERQLGEYLRRADIEGRAGEESYKENTMEHAAPFFCKHF